MKRIFVHSQNVRNPRKEASETPENVYIYIYLVRIKFWINLNVSICPSVYVTSGRKNSTTFAGQCNKFRQYISQKLQPAD